MEDCTRVSEPVVNSTPVHLLCDGHVTSRNSNPFLYPGSVEGGTEGVPPDKKAYC